MLYFTLETHKLLQYHFFHKRHHFQSVFHHSLTERYKTKNIGDLPFLCTIIIKLGIDIWFCLDAVALTERRTDG